MSEFVSFEIAKKLKEKGFNYPCIAHYDINKELRVVIREPIFWHSDVLSYIDAPTISQVLKWLREEKNVSIDISIHCSLKWVYSLHIFDEDLFMDLTPYTDLYTDGVVNDTIYELYDSYEEAALAGIEYALDNLDNLFNFQ